MEDEYFICEPRDIHIHQLLQGVQRLLFRNILAHLMILLVRLPQQTLISFLNSGVRHEILRAIHLIRIIASIICIAVIFLVISSDYFD